MMEEANILIIGNNQDQIATIKKELKTIDGLNPIIKTTTLEQAWDIILDGRPNILIITINEKHTEHLDFVEKVKSHYHGISIFIVSDYTDSDYILNLYKNGITDFFKYPLAEGDLTKSFKKNLTEQSSLNQDTQQGKIISVFSNKGGIGVTTLAVNLATSLALQQKAKVLLCDFVLNSGDISIFLDTDNQYTVNELIYNLNRIDNVFLNNSLSKTAQGVYVLHSPLNPEDSEYINSVNLSELLLKLKHNFDFIVIDTAHNYSDTNITIFDHSDLILNLVTLELPCICSTAKSLEIFQKLRYDRDKVKLIVNRTNAKNQIEVKLVEEKLQYPIFFQLPNDYAIVVKAINNGQPIVEISKTATINTAINSLTSVLIKAMEKNFTPDKKSLFSKLLKKK